MEACASRLVSQSACCEELLRCLQSAWKWCQCRSLETVSCMQNKELGFKYSCFPSGASCQNQLRDLGVPVGWVDTDSSEACIVRKCRGNFESCNNGSEPSSEMVSTMFCACWKHSV